MENLKKSNELLEAIINGTAFDSETGMIWNHWLEEISKQIDMNNTELRALAKQPEQQSNCNLPHVSKCYVVRDWMSAEVHEFDTIEEGNIKFDEIYNETKNDECDIQLYRIIKEYNNVK